MKVYAFEWQDCIYESAMAVVSLHETKRGAVKAMVKEANKRWLEDRCFMGRGWEPLRTQRWRVICYEVMK